MKKRILIIENEAEMRLLEKDILNTAGYEVLEADNAKDGIELALKEKPDLILMDIRLPYKQRGIGTAKIIRNNEKTGDIPIIFVTAYPMWEQSEEVKSISNCGYITKPFKIRVFVEYIRKYIG